MTRVSTEVEGLRELIAKFDQLPREVQQALIETMDQSLLVVWENVPPYIPQVVPPSVYRRTGTLGGSFGVAQAGGKSGRPDIYSVQVEPGKATGQFGSNLKYAPYVVDPERQAYMHRPGYKGRPGWWTMETVKENSKDKIVRIWKTAVEKIARFLER